MCYLYLPSDVSNAFQISHANKSFHVFGQSAADKANWIANLQKHISRVAKTRKLMYVVILVPHCIVDRSLLTIAV